eukprot:1562702-Amphidinium_carterae.1
MHLQPCKACKNGAHVSCRARCESHRCIACHKIGPVTNEFRGSNAVVPALAANEADVYVGRAGAELVEQEAHDKFHQGIPTTVGSH